MPINFHIRRDMTFGLSSRELTFVPNIVRSVLVRRQALERIEPP